MVTGSLKLRWVEDKGCKVKGVGAILVFENFILRDVALEGYGVRFNKGCSRVLDAQESLVCLVLPFGKVFRVDFLSSSGPFRCFVASPSSVLWKWHRRLSHLSFDLHAKLSSLDLIRGLPKLKNERDRVCHPCRHGKMVAAFHIPAVNQVMTARPGELLRMDTVRPSRVQSVGGKWYVLVIVDDFSPLCNDNGLESKNDHFKAFCHSQGLEHQFSSPYVPQQNGVVEHKNRTPVEMARMMLDEHRTPRKFEAKAMNTACYVSNPVLNKTSYELRFGWQPKVSHLWVFGCRCFVLKQGNLDKFKPCSSDGVFLGYATHSRAYRIWLLDSGKIVETCDDEIGTTIFEDDEEDVGVFGNTAPAAAPEPAASLLEDDEGAPAPSPSTTWEQPPLDTPVHASRLVEDVGEVTTKPQLSRMVQRDHPSRNIIGGMNERVTRSRSTSIASFAHSAFVASFEPHDVGHALSDPNWVNAMHEKLENFERFRVWVLDEPPPHCNPIGTKWVFKNKQGEDGVVVRNKARLVAQGFCQKQGIDYEETIALEEVYVRQPPSFELPKFSNRVFKLQKALYGLKQAPRAWYERLRKFLVDQGFQMGSVDKTVVLLRHGKDLLIVQIYVDDIIFGRSSHALCSKFSEQMSREFQMSIMGELQLFLGLQIRQTPQGTFVHQSKYTRDLL
ncbi:hypothetical protein U9M48_013767 [Paspalum notatum var. saurae]|uniref:Integrase catalytic domain-containing protein n=1 Tax=Paspalum notatum var. saurae TaxID=547442 RepID=A0AAQ3WJW1_PASNO